MTADEPMSTPDSADDATVGERGDVECVCPTDDYCPKCHPRWHAKWMAEGCRCATSAGGHPCGVCLATAGESQDFATPPADDANRAPVSGGLDEGERSEAKASQSKAVPAVLYHWSPVANRPSIEREGLHPGSPSNAFPEWSPPHICYGETPSSALGLTLLDQPLDLWMIHTVEHGFTPANEGQEWRSAAIISAWRVATREARDPVVDMTRAEQEEADEIAAMLREESIANGEEDD